MIPCAPPTTTLIVDVQGDAIRHQAVLAGNTEVDYVQTSRPMSRAVFQVWSFVYQGSMGIGTWVQADDGGHDVIDKFEFPCIQWKI